GHRFDGGEYRGLPGRPVALRGAAGGGRPGQRRGAVPGRALRRRVHGAPISEHAPAGGQRELREKLSRRRGGGPEGRPLSWAGGAPVPPPAALHFRGGRSIMAPETQTAEKPAGGRSSATKTKGGIPNET